MTALASCSPASVKAIGFPVNFSLGKRSTRVWEKWLLGLRWSERTKLHRRGQSWMLGYTATSLPERTCASIAELGYWLRALSVSHLWDLLFSWRDPHCSRSLLLQKTRCIPRLVIFKRPFWPQVSPWTCLNSCYCTAARLLPRLILLPSHSIHVLILTTIPQIFLYTKFQLRVNFLGNLTWNVNTYSYTAVHTLKRLVQGCCVCLPELPSSLKACLPNIRSQIHAIHSLPHFCLFSFIFGKVFC